MSSRTDHQIMGGYIVIDNEHINLNEIVLTTSRGRPSRPVRQADTHTQERTKSHVGGQIRTHGD